MVMLWALRASWHSHLGEVMDSLGDLKPWRPNSSSVTN